MKKIIVFSGLFFAFLCQALAQNIGATSIEKMTYIYQLKKVIIDTVFCDDAGMSDNKRAEAYQKSSAVYDSTIVAVKYNRGHLWFTRSFIMEYKIAKFDAVKKEIKSEIFVTESKEAVAYEMMLVAIFIFLILFSIFFVIIADPKNREMTDESVFGNLILAPGLFCSLTILIFSFYSQGNPFLWGVLSAYIIFTAIAWMLSIYRLWNRKRYVFAQCLSYLIIVALLKILTQDLILFIASLVVLVALLAFFWWTAKD